MRKQTIGIIVAIIGAAGLVLAALIGIYPQIRNQKTGNLLAGIVVSSNKGFCHQARRRRGP